MAKLMFSVMCALIFAGCTMCSIGNDPIIDGQDMMYKTLSALKDGDNDKANRIIGDYLEYYISADNDKKTEFCNASTERYWHKMMTDNNSDWAPFFEKMAPLMQWYMESDVALSSLPEYTKLREFQTATLGPED